MFETGSGQWSSSLAFAFNLFDLDCEVNSEGKVICFNLSEHGHLDLSAYQAFLEAQLEIYEISDSQIQRNLEEIQYV